MCITLRKIRPPVHIRHCHPPLKLCVAAAARSPACQRRIIRWSSQSFICQAKAVRSELEAISNERYFTCANRKVAATQEKSVEALRWCGFCRTHRMLRHFKAIASKDGSVVNYAPYCAGCTYRNSKLRDLVYWQGMDLVRAEAEVERMIDNQPGRQCSCCEEELPASFFGRYKQCRTCVKVKDKNRQRNAAAAATAAADVKECGRCGKLLPGSSFYVYTRSSSGLKAFCKDCNKLYVRDSNARIRSVPRLKSTLPNSQICSKCGQEKLLSDFRTSRYSPRGVRSQCKLCLKAHGMEYYRSGNET